MDYNVRKNSSTLIIKEPQGQEAYLGVCQTSVLKFFCKAAKKSS